MQISFVLIDSQTPPFFPILINVNIYRKTKMWVERSSSNPLRLGEHLCHCMPCHFFGYQSIHYLFHLCCVIRVYTTLQPRADVRNRFCSIDHSVSQLTLKSRSLLVCLTLSPLETTGSWNRLRRGSAKFPHSGSSFQTSWERLWQPVLLLERSGMEE